MFNSGIPVKQLIDELKSEVDVAPEIKDDAYITWLNSLQQLLYGEIIKEQGKYEDDYFDGSIIPIDDINVSIGENKPRFEDIHAVYADKTQLIESTVASGVIFPNTYYKVANDIGVNLTNRQTFKCHVGDAVPNGTNVVLKYIHSPLGGDRYDTGGVVGIYVSDGPNCHPGDDMHNVGGGDYTGHNVTNIWCYDTGETTQNEYSEDWYAVFEVIEPKSITIIYFVKPELIDDTNYDTKHVAVPIEFIDLVKAKLRGEAYKVMNEDALAAKWLNDYNVLLENFKAWIEEKKPNFGL